MELPALPSNTRPRRQRRDQPRPLASGRPKPSRGFGQAQSRPQDPHPAGRWRRSANPHARGGTPARGAGSVITNDHSPATVAGKLVDSGIAGPRAAVGVDVICGPAFVPGG